MRSVILHCPQIGRDLTQLRAAVPDALVHEAQLQENGCLIGHQAIVKQALLDGEWAVWVLEDDAQLLPTFNRARWERDAEWAFAHDYGMLIGACATSLRPRTVRDGLIEVQEFRSAHCVVYLPTGMDALLRITQRPLDVQLAHFGARPLVTVPFVAHQRPGLSGTLGHYTNYTSFYRKQEQQLTGVVGIGVGGAAR